MRKFLLLLVICFSYLTVTAQVLRKRTVTLMGSRFDISIVAADSLSAEKNIDQAIAEIDRIEQLISDWIPGSQVSAINRMAGIQPVKVDREVLQLTERALRISEQTEGAFDISFAAMDRIWKFDGSMEQVPDSATIQRAIANIGYRSIQLDTLNSTIYLTRKGMKIGFGATGKGYAADRCREHMKVLDVQAGIINASGDLTTWGSQPDGTAWRIGVTNPFRRSRPAAILEMYTGAVTTSGDYEKYVEINGKRYSHIINPKTGMPSYGLTSVTVIGPDAETCNGFSTAIMVLGKKKGLQLINKYPAFGCLMVNTKGRKHRSKYFKKVLRQIASTPGS